MRRYPYATFALALALALATLAGVARLTAPTTDAAALAAPCEIRVWVNNVPTGPRFAISAAQYPEFCGAPPTATPLPPTATAVPPTNTPVPPTPTSPPGAVTGPWHAPTDHEHGDAPPSFVVNWIAANAAAYGSSTLIFGGDENTGPLENSMKHPAYKGFVMTSPAGTQIYLRYHAAANPMDRSAQFHSYEVWFLDTAGGVSFLQGWYDSGDPRPHPDGDRVPRRLGDPGQRPIMLVVDQQSYQQQSGFCEQWYMHGQGAYGPEFAVTICNVPYLYNANENATAHDVNTWQRHPDGGLGLHRRAETFWFPDRGTPGVSYRTAMGATCTAGTVGCLYNYVAPTLANDARVEFGVTRILGQDEKTFPDGGGTVGPIN